MATLIAIVFSVVMGALTLTLAVLNVREKLWPKVVPPHPLAGELRDLAAAVRELRLRDFV